MANGFDSKLAPRGRAAIELSVRLCDKLLDGLMRLGDKNSVVVLVDPGDSVKSILTAACEFGPHVILLEDELVAGSIGIAVVIGRGHD